MNAAGGTFDIVAQVYAEVILHRAIACASLVIYIVRNKAQLLTNITCLLLLVSHYRISGTHTYTHLNTANVSSIYLLLYLRRSCF